MSSRTYGGNSLASALDEERLEVLKWMKEREEQKYRELCLDYDPVIRDYCFIKPGDEGFRVKSEDITSLPHYKNPPTSNEYKKDKEKSTQEEEKRKNIPSENSKSLAKSSSKVSDVLASPLFSTDSPPNTSHKRHSFSSVSSKSSSTDQAYAALHPYGGSELKKSPEPNHQRSVSFGSMPASSSSLSPLQIPSTSATTAKHFSPKEPAKTYNKSNTTPSSPVTKLSTSPKDTPLVSPNIPHFVVSPPSISSTSENRRTNKDEIGSPLGTENLLDENGEPLHLARSLPSSSSEDEDEDDDFSSHSEAEGLQSTSRPQVSIDESPKLSQPLVSKRGKTSKRSRLRKLVGAPLSKSKSNFSDDSHRKVDANVLRRSRSNPSLYTAHELRSEPVRPNTNFVSTHVDNWYGSDQEEIEQDLRIAKNLQLNIGPTRWIPSASRTIRRIRRGDFHSAASNSKRNSTYFLTLDLSSESLYAAEWAVGVLLRKGDTLIIVDVIECDDPKLEMEHMESTQMETLEKVTKSILKLLSKTVLEIEVNIEVIHHEKAKHLIVEMIDYVEPTLVVMGSRGRSHLKGVLLGSFSNYLVNKSSVPVMVARKRLRKNKHRFERSARLANNLADAIVDEVGR
ncbi:Usp (universal stress protein) family protein [Schizosaccharomyces osmophilus]|uniref:Usp (Universal stress protein) family protein n=1 Tax=Schizosaccharomyces osmophilus TaxID=2545709 RepID=A0AAF0AWD6_9SCHI|nr:Usp (universal stress protein) family protein [Schizosaccharomyces osmophilus]WBW72829.1 Usp (universal stress protein) family protein [Schizosaccharomyces osmophilus]